MKISPEIQREIDAVSLELEKFGLSWLHFQQFLTEPFFPHTEAATEDAAVVYPKRKKRYAYIAHKMGDDVVGNTHAVLEICRRISDQRIEAFNMRFPFPIYLVAFEYLNDAIEEQRALGMRINALFFRLRTFDELWLCGPKISSGMKIEIALAHELGILICCYNPALQPELDRILSGLEKPV